MGSSLAGTKFGGYGERHVRCTTSREELVVDLAEGNAMVGSLERVHEVTILQLQSREFRYARKVFAQFEKAGTIGAPLAPREADGSLCVLETVLTGPRRTPRESDKIERCEATRVSCVLPSSLDPTTQLNQPLIRGICDEL